MKDTWASRDLPVLNAVVTALEDTFRVSAGEVASATGIPAEDVVRAFYALQWTYTGQLTGSLGRGPAALCVSEVTADARRAVGQWPTGESLIERLATGMMQAAERDPDQKRRLLVVARELGGAARTIAINVASEILEHRLPH